MRKPAVFVWTTGMVGLLGCGTLLGLDEESASGVASSSSGAAESPGDASSGTDEDSGRLRSGSSSGGGSSSGDAGPAMLAAPSCGDMSAYAASSWPMAGACPTRPGAVAAPPITAPRSLWRFDYPAGDSLISAPVLGADGTVYAVLGSASETSYMHFLVGVRAGTETMRARLPALAGESPSIAADGTLYVRAGSALVAIDPRAGGHIAWTRTVASLNADSPVLLTDGTIVTVTERELVFTTRTGTEARAPVSLGTDASSPRFTGSLCVSPDAALYVSSTTGRAGALHTYAANGLALREPIALDLAPVGSPSLTLEGRLLVAQNSILTVVVPESAIRDRQITLMRAIDGRRSARSGSRHFFHGGVRGPFSFDTATGVIAELADRSGNYSDFSVAGDGSLLVVRRTSPPVPQSRLESWSPDGTIRWFVPLSDAGGPFNAPAIGPDGTAYLAHGTTVYAIGN